jgi:hypothetical protein
MRIVTREQNTAEWFQAKCGKVGASSVNRALSMLKSGKSSADRENYKAEMIAEILTGLPTEHYVSPAMDWGVENESLARAEYAFRMDCEVERTGFVLHPTIDRLGASPDGLIGTDGGLEIKCPNTATHIKWMRDGIVPEEHRLQMYTGMVCCERDWWEFMSFDPRLPQQYQVFIRRLERDDEQIAAIEAGVEQFLVEVLETIEMLGKANPLQAQLKASVEAM